jgi:hypothetical protein
MPNESRIEERAYKSLWHLIGFAIGIYEFRNHKSTTAKVIAAGLIAFHADAAISDALDTQPLSRRILEYIRPEEHDLPPNNRRTKSKG